MSLLKADCYLSFPQSKGKVSGAVNHLNPIPTTNVDTQPTSNISYIYGFNTFKVTYCFYSNRALVKS